MLFLVAALLLMGVVLGAVAHAPLTFTVAAAPSSPSGSASSPCASSTATTAAPPRTDPHGPSDRPPTAGVDHHAAHRTGRPPHRIRDTDGMAVASFVLGLLGLLVLNVFLGPSAIVLASVALLRGTARRGRALLGLGLGVADLVVLAVFMQADGTISWSF